jgi:hypothetical protein
MAQFDFAHQLFRFRLRIHDRQAALFEVMFQQRQKLPLAVESSAASVDVSGPTQGAPQNHID